MEHSHSNEIMLLPSTPATGLLSTKMAFPGQPLRPLKKRRIVSVDRKNEYRTTDGEKREVSLLADKKTKTREMEGIMTGVVTIAPSPPSSPIRRKKSVTWNDREGNLIYSQQGPTATTKRFFSSFDESDVWYTRENYYGFLLDRIETIEAHRSTTTNTNMNMNTNTNTNTNTSNINYSEENKNSNENNSNNTNSSNYCIRGLELFQDKESTAIYHSKKNRHRSTVIMEQARQKKLGTNAPERFRFLVVPQSDLALRRAQQLAAQDEREVYPFRRQPAMPSLAACDYASFSVVGTRSRNGRIYAYDRSQLHQLGQVQVQVQQRQLRSALIQRERLFSSGVELSTHDNSTSTTTTAATANSGTTSGTTRRCTRTGSSSNTSNPNFPNNISSMDTGSFDLDSCGSSIASSTTTRSTNSVESDNSADSLFTDRILRLQQQNARRLMGIYQQNGEWGAGQDNVNKLFRFARRESLLGIGNGGTYNSTTRSNSMGTTVPSMIAMNTDANTNMAGSNTNKHEVSDGIVSAQQMMMAMHRRRQLQQNVQQEQQQQQQQQQQHRQ
uniref:Uncharacterized protein n=1 Tax=Pseudo-nitzschia australis TaxID=44445 RepID=A0A7S4AKS2_9STRA